MTTLQRISARLVATTNIALTGVPIIDSVQTVAGDEVLLVGQTAAAENGLWVIPSSGAWTTRGADFDTPGEMLKGTEFNIREGSPDNAGSTWEFRTGGTIVVNTTSLSFVRTGWGGGAIDESSGTDRAFNLLGLPEQPGVAGTWELPTVVYNSRGIATSVTSGPALGSGYIEGAGLRYVSATEVALDVGAFYLPGLNRIVEVDSAITTTRLTGNNALYYAYGCEVNGAGQLELSTTAPDVPYFGSARTKIGDDTRRYLGMFRNDGSGNLIPFDSEVLGGAIVRILYGLQHDSTTLRVLNAAVTGTSLLFEDIGPSAATAANRLVSPTAHTVEVFGKVTSNRVWLGYPTNYPAFGLPPTVIGQTTDGAYATTRVSDTQSIGYMSGGVGTLTLYVSGYFERR